MRRPLVAGTLLATLVLAGCGGGDSDATAKAASAGPSSDAGPSSNAGQSAAAGADAGAIVVVAKDISFAERAFTGSAGTLNLQYRNEGSIAHTLLIENVDGFKLAVAAKGDADDGSVALEPGTYKLFCDVPGHRPAGMEATLQVS